VSIDEDIRLDDDVLAYGSLDWETATVDLGLDSFDHDARSVYPDRTQACTGWLLGFVFLRHAPPVVRLQHTPTQPPLQKTSRASRLHEQRLAGV
jgi:hypothetical protein